MENRTVDVFLTELASGAPTPGGGGASAVCGAIAAALGSMVGNLTSGKKKYAEYQEEIEVAIAKCGSLVKEFEALGKKDEEVFEPLAKAYSIPKDQEGRDEILEPGWFRRSGCLWDGLPGRRRSDIGGPGIWRG